MCCSRSWGVPLRRCLEWGWGAGDGVQEVPQMGLEVQEVSKPGLGMQEMQDVPKWG